MESEERSLMAMAEFSGELRRGLGDLSGAMEDVDFPGLGGGCEEVMGLVEEL